MTNQTDAIAQQVTDAGLVAIVRGDFSQRAILEIADTLAHAGISVLEITLNTTGALEAIAALRTHFGEALLIGAGTVRTAEQVEAAHAAGAQFLVSPGFDLETVRRAQQRGLLQLPGVFTPTEVQQAAAAGCRMLKLFPADMFGPRYLKALRAPFDDIALVPTGGVNAANLGDYVSAGAVALGLGSALVTGPGQRPDELAARAQELRSALLRARQS